MKRGAHEILNGSCMDVLPTLPAGKFHCCATSPPYFALRSYLPDGHPDKDKEIGSEPTPEAFVATMVEVFREVRRVLRDDGILWVNLGSSYSVGGKWSNGNSTSPKHADGVSSFMARPDCGLPAGNDMLTPHRVALALQADGWVLRQTICWAKRSPMPESVNGTRWVRCRVKVGGQIRGTQSHASEIGLRDNSGGIASSPQAQWEPCPGCPKCEPNGGYVLRRGQGRCTTAFEYVFLFAKKSSYFWDMENCREDCADRTQFTYSRPAKVEMSTGPMARGTEGFNHQFADPDRVWGNAGTRIPRNVWLLSSEPTKFNHFATFPSELVRRMLAPLSPKGCCPECGQQWAPVVDTERVATRPGLANKIWKHEDGDKIGQRSDSSPNLDPQRHLSQVQVLGYRPTCQCGIDETAPCEVLDPFSGTGTTGQTACYLGHNYTGIELNPEYAAFTEEWINREPRWATRQRKTKKKTRDELRQPLLF